jgi:tRNA-2-methylthio-N6-dimethylallyladenosine synthase
LYKNNILDTRDYKRFSTRNLENKGDGNNRAFVNISFGCDNFCSYCVVPYSRGEEVSRSKKDILSEIDVLIKNGCTKITLCGQNVNSWGLSKKERLGIRTGSNQKLPFASLLREVHGRKNLEEISFISSNPFDFTADLVDATSLPKISNYIHIAAQSGNNDVLVRMNRNHTVEDFIKLIEDIKKVKPNLELGTDIIVGFPGETRDQFMDTVNLFHKIKFNVAFISMYSPRKGTFAQKNYEDDVTLKEKKYRHYYLTKVWRETLHE